MIACRALVLIVGKIAFSTCCAAPGMTRGDDGCLLALPLPQGNESQGSRCGRKPYEYITPARLACEITHPLASGSTLHMKGRNVLQYQRIPLLCLIVDTFAIFLDSLVAVRRHQRSAIRRSKTPREILTISACAMLRGRALMDISGDYPGRAEGIGARCVMRVVERTRASRYSPAEHLATLPLERRRAQGPHNE